MSYSDRVNRLLKPAVGPDNPLVVDLFAGCSGLSLGFEAAGFNTIGYEMVESYVETYNSNLEGVCHHVELNTETQVEKASIVIGGPPCQPFSEIGAKRGLKDSRDGFPIFISVIQSLNPQIWMFENVRGMTFDRHKWYLNEIIEKLRCFKYNITSTVINCADFGVPQTRQRLFVVGTKKDFDFVAHTHTKNDYVTAKEALGELAEQYDKNSKFLTEAQDKYISEYEKKSQVSKPRDLHMDLPARTLTCRNIAAATSDMHRVKLPDGRRRRITVREAARLQSFPDWFEFKGSELDQFYQIGNAVPPLLAKILAESFKKYLEVNSSDSKWIPTKEKIQTTLTEALE